MVAPDVIALLASSLCLESAVPGLGQATGFSSGLFFSEYCSGLATALLIRKVSGPQTSESGLFFCTYYNHYL